MNAEGYIVLAFPYVCSVVCKYVHLSFSVIELCIRILASKFLRFYIYKVCGWIGTGRVPVDVLLNSIDYYLNKSIPVIASSLFPSSSEKFICYNAVTLF